VALADALPTNPTARRSIHELPDKSITAYRRVVCFWREELCGATYRNSGGRFAYLLDKMDRGEAE
jgi:hypothetical protein